MAYTKSGQIPVGGKYTLGDYTFSLTTQDIPVTDFKYVYSEIVDGAGKRDGKGVNLQLNRPIESWYVEATETEASVYARCSNDTMPHHISVVKLPDKVVYNTGDAIDLTGIEVRAFNSDGTAWANDTYPDGYIPINELLSQFRMDQKYGFNLAGSVLWREEEYTGYSGTFTIGDSDYTSRSFIPYIEGAEFSITVMGEYSSIYWVDDPDWAKFTATIRINVPIGTRLALIKKKTEENGLEFIEMYPIVAQRKIVKNADIESVADRQTEGWDAGPISWGRDYYYNLTSSKQLKNVKQWLNEPAYYLKRAPYNVDWDTAAYSNRVKPGSTGVYSAWGHNFTNHPNLPTGTSFSYNSNISLFDGYTYKGKYVEDYTRFTILSHSIPYFDIDEVMNYTADAGKKPSESDVLSRVCYALFKTDDNKLRDSEYEAITIAWKRPIDGAVLTTSFGIANADD